ncbi:MAG TPA: hypothetical protein VLV55_08305 [Rhizomicrobium sp.]|nr:hypothetical protein [Rhizomicrobium sp.]
MKTVVAATLAALIGTASIVAIPAMPASAAAVVVHVGGGGWMWHGRRWHHRHWDCRWHRHRRACYWRYW